MTYSSQLDLAISDIEYSLSKYNLVQSHFPDCKLTRYYPGYITKDPKFISKSVNQNYNNLKFNATSSELSVIPYTELHFNFKDKCEVVNVYSDPQKFILARINDKKISFTKLSINLKNNNFNDKMLNDCRTNILNFIKSNPSYKIDDNHLEPRLKKLLIFT